MNTSFTRCLPFELIFTILACFAPVYSVAQQSGVIEFPSAMAYHTEKDIPYLLHELNKGQTLFQLKKLYGVELDEIRAMNPRLDPESIRDNTLVKIPLDNKEIESRINRLEDNRYYAAIYYTAAPKETLFRIGRRIFGVSIRDLQQNNTFEKGQLQVGQTIFIGWIETHPGSDRSVSKRVENPVVQTASAEEAPATQPPEEHPPRSGKEVMESMPVQSGVAFWHKERKNKGGMFVLHRTAPQGSFIEIENPMFDKSVRAKVIGNLPPETYPDEVVVVVSPAIAAALGALDSRFFVKIRYLQTGIFPVKQ